MAGRPGSLTIEDARLIFRNFSGEEGMYNRAGDRNFAVVLDPELAERMKADEWNIKYLKPRDLNDKGESEEEPTPYVSVAVSWRNRPPTIVLISSKGRTMLDEASVDILDKVDIENVDLIINPSRWTQPGGKTGIKAYLQSMYITVFEDDLARKYDVLEPSTVNGPAMSSDDDPMHIHAVRGEMQELER